MRRRHLLATPLLLTQLPARAAEWPTRPVKLVVTFPPGGSSDLVARLIAPGLQERLKQPVVIENKPGAGGTIAATSVATATDNHTLLVANAAPISISPYILPSLPYQPLRDFSHVAFLGAVPNVILVHPGAPPRDFAGLVAWLKAGGDGIGCGSNGIGSVSHVVLEMLKKSQGVATTHVPYRGSGPMIADLLGGTTKMAIDSLPQNIDPIRIGQLRGILLTSAGRSPKVPGVPAAGEIGLPELIAENWIGLSGPARLSPDAQAVLAAATAEVMKLPNVATRMDEWGFSSEPMSPSAFTAFLTKQAEAWVPAVKASGATLN
jgi:tripartite-type tricarboxylate transporter receptor subunit TctC